MKLRERIAEKLWRALISVGLDGLAGHVFVSRWMWPDD